MNQITTMRLPDGAEVAFVDWSDKPLWSSVDLLSGFTDTEVNAFTYVVGDEVPATVNATVRRIASDRDTNVSTPGSMASTEEMLVYAIKPEYNESRTADGNPTELDVLTYQQQGQPIPRSNRLAILQDQLILQLEVSQKIEHSAPLGYYNTGFGVLTSMQSTNATALSSRGTAGLPSQEAVRSLGIPVHIGGQEKYRVALVNAAAAAVPSGQNEATPPVNDAQIVHTVRVYLDGLYKRPVS